MYDDCGFELWTGSYLQRMHSDIQTSSGENVFLFIRSFVNTVSKYQSFMQSCTMTPLNKVTPSFSKCGAICQWKKVKIL